jgi:hypothetical protein
MIRIVESEFTSGIEWSLPANGWNCRAIDMTLEIQFYEATEYAMESYAETNQSSFQSDRSGSVRDPCSGLWMSDSIKSRTHHKSMNWINSNSQCFGCHPHHPHNRSKLSSMIQIWFSNCRISQVQAHDTLTSKTKQNKTKQLITSNLIACFPSSLPLSVANSTRTGWPSDSSVEPGRTHQFNNSSSAMAMFSTDCSSHLSKNIE